MKRPKSFCHPQSASGMQWLACWEGAVETFGVSLVTSRIVVATDVFAHSGVSLDL